MGRVTSTDGEPLQEARVLLVGTALNTVTGQDGRYALRNVPTGPQTVRVLRVGYREQKKATTVGANATVGMDFALEKSVVQLEEIVSTATGSRPREELVDALAVSDTDPAQVLLHSSDGPRWEVRAVVPDVDPRGRERLCPKRGEQLGRTVVLTVRDDKNLGSRYLDAPPANVLIGTERSR